MIENVYETIPKCVLLNTTRKSTKKGAQTPLNPAISTLFGLCVKIYHSYEWGYTYGPPMAVAPLPNVRRVVEYALTEMPAQKIWLGIPNYGYDWPLPFAEGVTRATSISNQYAVRLALRYGAEIRYDTFAQSPWFRYTDEQGREHEVWFEDARSIQAKLALIPEYGLYGAGYWNLMRPFPQNWLILDSEYNIRQG